MKKHRYLLIVALALLFAGPCIAVAVLHPNCNTKPEPSPTGAP
jgi:hypothetical protein